MSILIVDDSKFILKFIEQHLLSAGFKDIKTFVSGEAVLTFLNENENHNQVDLILMDVFMEGASGLTICQTIKQDPRFSDIQVMIMTSNTSEDILEDSFKVGAIDYITKPIRKTELLARVRSAVKLKKEMDKVKTREQELIEVKNKLELANLELARLVSLDGLTGIPNRRSFDENIILEWQKAYSENNCLGLIMIDIDCFKLFNDTYGHQAGDHCLQKVAYAIRQTLKGSLDFVARYGGEEFAVILPSTDLLTTMQIAEKIREKVQLLGIPHKSTTLPVGVITISLGSASMLPREVGFNNWTKLIKEADEALYKAKQSGRNVVKKIG